VLLFVFHDDDMVQRMEYAREMAAARAKTEVAVKEEAAKTVAQPLTQEQKLAAGKVIFDKTCVVCHGKFGEGLVGPNFTDEYHDC
jgi:cytochrome c oxidase cbb3-type subunit 3